jgi:MFS transporter, DHA1 family, multidrug resistance protein
MWHRTESVLGGPQETFVQHHLHPGTHYPSEPNSPTPRSTSPNQMPAHKASDDSLLSADSGLFGQDHDRDLEKAGQAPLPQPETKKDRKDPNLVDWDGPDDPENPQNWSLKRKWLVTGCLATMTLTITFASSVFSTATMIVSEEYGVGAEVGILGTSLFVLGFAFGPIAWGPLSETYGRMTPLFTCFAIFAIFQIPVAVAQNIYTIMICRFFGGLFGCAPLVIVGGAFADFWNPVDRGVAVAIFAAATFIGPVAGPIVGGFVTQSHLGWRWTAWLTLIMAAASGGTAVFIVPETYAGTILQRRATRLRHETKNWALHAKLDEQRVTASDILTRYLYRPFKMLIQEPILLLISIYLALIYGILYLFFEAYPISFQQERGWNLGVGALPFLGITVGVVFGAVLVSWITKTRFARKLKKHGRVVPEERLPPMIIGGMMLPIGLFWFAWTSNKNIHWAPQVVAGVPIGMGIFMIFMQGLNYLIDVYLMFANSAIAANTVFRSLAGAGFPLFATQMYHKLGVNWASSLLGFLTAAMVPVPVLFYIYGKKIRAMSKFAPNF